MCYALYVPLKNCVTDDWLYISMLFIIITLSYSIHIYIGRIGGRLVLPLRRGVHQAAGLRPHVRTVYYTLYTTRQLCIMRIYSTKYLANNYANIILMIYSHIYIHLY